MTLSILRYPLEKKETLNRGDNRWSREPIDLRTLKILQTKSLDFSYGRSRILSNIKFELEKAQIWALIGPNGSGKSTLLRCLSGLLSPDRGEVICDGFELRKMKRKQVARKICFLPQNQVHLQYMRVYDLVALGRSPYCSWGWYLSQNDKEKISWALEYMNLTDLQYRLLDSLSGGERQRVWIAMILAQDTPIVLLDEPVTFLDLKYQWDLIEKIHDIRNKLSKSFVIVFHDVNHALAIADKILVLKEGKVYREGCPSKVINSQLLYEVYDIRARVCAISRHPRPVIIPQSVGQ